MSLAMPNPLGLTRLQPEKVFPGYTLYCTMSSSRVVLLNLRGEVVHAWNAPLPVFYGYMLENGNLLCGCQTKEFVGPPQGRTGTIVELDWDGNVVWEYQEPSLHHDHCRLSNGNTLVLGREVVPPEISSRVKGGKPGADPHGEMWGDLVREVTPAGQIVWEWHSHDHLDPDEDPICPLCDRHEWTHGNTCEALPDGNVLTSFRHLNTVAIIDKASGRFAWKWGRSELGHQHDPTPLDNGSILIFDNGFHGPFGFGRSRIVEVDPKTDQIAWQYSASPPWDFFSGHISGAQRLPNGNTLVCEGTSGRIFEVTPPGEIVWEYRNPQFEKNATAGWFTNNVFRAYRYGPDFSGFSGKTLDPARWTWLNNLL